MPKKTSKRSASPSTEGGKSKGTPSKRVRQSCEPRGFTVSEPAAPKVSRNRGVQANQAGNQVGAGSNQKQSGLRSNKVTFDFNHFNAQLRTMGNLDLLQVQGMVDAVLRSRKLDVHQAPPAKRVTVKKKKKDTVNTLQVTNEKVHTFK